MKHSTKPEPTQPADDNGEMGLIIYSIGGVVLIVVAVFYFFF